VVEVDLPLEKSWTNQVAFPVPNVYRNT